MQTPICYWCLRWRCILNRKENENNKSTRIFFYNKYFTGKRRHRKIWTELMAISRHHASIYKKPLYSRNHKFIRICRTMHNNKRLGSQMAQLIDDTTPKQRELLLWVSGRGWTPGGWRPEIKLETKRLIYGCWVDRNSFVMRPTHWMEMPDEPE